MQLKVFFDFGWQMELCLPRMCLANVSGGSYFECRLNVDSSSEKQHKQSSLTFTLNNQSTQYKCTHVLFLRSASYRASTGECRLSDMDRHTVAGTGAFTEAVGEEYLENNCVDDPVKLCDFQLLENRIMKTVDSVYQVRVILPRPNSLRLCDFVSDLFNCPGCADNGGVQGSVSHCPVQVSVFQFGQHMCGLKLGMIFKHTLFTRQISRKAFF